MRRRHRSDAGGPLRIAYLTPTLEPGGAERQMLILATTLPTTSFEIRFLVMSGPAPLASEAEAAGVRVHFLGLDRGRCAGIGIRCLPAVLRSIRRYRALTADVDIVDGWLIPAMIFSAVTRPVAGVPVLMGGRRSLSDVYASKSRARRWLAAFAARRMDAIVANSQVAADEALRLDGVASARISVIPNAVFPAAPAASTRGVDRSAWGFGEGHVVVGCVANYKAGKGLMSLVQVAHRLRRRQPDLRYVLVGEGPLRPDLEAEIRRLDLDDVVRLHGRAADARRLYGAFDVFLQASETEGLPNVVLEAAAQGLPIVATAVGGTAEILTSDVDGVLVPGGDLERLIDAIDEVASDPDLRDRLGRAARTRSEHYSPASLVRSTGELYRRLAGRDGEDVTGRAGRAASSDA